MVNEAITREDGFQMSLIPWGFFDNSVWIPVGSVPFQRMVEIGIKSGALRALAAPEMPDCDSARIPASSPRPYSISGGMRSSTSPFGSCSRSIA